MKVPLISISWLAEYRTCYTVVAHKYSYGRGDDIERAKTDKKL